MIYSEQQADWCPDVTRDRTLSMGKGQQAIVFLHGLFGTPEHWRSIMSSLSGEYLAIAPQLPLDRQPNQRSRGIRSIDELVDHVADLILSLQLPPVVLCGNSLGGLLSIEFCLRHPDRVAGLVLAGSAGVYERSLTSGARPKPSREFVRSIASDIFADPGLITGQMVDEWYEAVLDRDYVRFLLRLSRATRDRRLDHELKRLDLPTLIVWGRDDKVTPPDVAELFQQQIEGSRLEFIDDCGHAPNLEKPAIFTELMEDFLPRCFPVESV